MSVTNNKQPGSVDGLLNKIGLGKKEAKSNPKRLIAGMSLAQILLPAFGLRAPTLEEMKAAPLTPEFIVHAYKSKLQPEVTAEKNAIESLQKRINKLVKFEALLFVAQAVSLVALVLLAPYIAVKAAIIWMLGIKLSMTPHFLGLLSLSQNKAEKETHEKILADLQQKLETYEKDVNFIKSMVDRGITAEQFDHFEWMDEGQVHQLSETLALVKEAVNLKDRLAYIAKKLVQNEAVIKACTAQIGGGIDLQTLQETIADTGKESQDLAREQKKLFAELEQKNRAFGSSYNQLAALLAPVADYEAIEKKQNEEIKSLTKTGKEHLKEGSVDLAVREFATLAKLKGLEKDLSGGDDSIAWGLRRLQTSGKEQTKLQGEIAGALIQKGSKLVDTDFDAALINFRAAADIKA